MSNPISKQVIDKIVTILDKLQERVTRIGRESAQNRDTLAALEDSHTLLSGSIDALSNAVIETQKRITTNTLSLVDETSKIKRENDERSSQLKTDTVQLKSGQETSLNRIQEVEFKNNKREEAQTLRDQNNVQALVNLRDSTKKAFDQVAGDVKSLLTAVQRLNERVGQVESQNIILAKSHGDVVIQTNANRLNVDELLKFKARTETNPSLSSDHVWVNKKLTSVYAVTEELEKRIQKLEAPAPPTQTPQPIAIPYLGYVVRVLNNSLYIGDEKFIFSDYIRDVRVQPYGVIVTLRQGNQYIVCGGPSPASMYVNLLKKA